LITRTPQEYERRALELARAPQQLAALRARLARNRDAGPLFDTPRYVQSLESAYHAMWERHAAGQPPASFHVPARV
jgi:protein O-GlcNAc transferase